MGSSAVPVPFTIRGDDEHDSTVMGLGDSVSDQKSGGVLLHTEGAGEGVATTEGLVRRVWHVLVYRAVALFCSGFVLAEWVTGMLVRFGGDFVVVGWGCSPWFRLGWLL